MLHYPHERDRQPVEAAHHLERYQEGINDQERLRQLLFTLFEVDSMEGFMNHIDAERENSESH
jgi:hypothetical protein